MYVQTNIRKCVDMRTLCGYFDGITSLCFTFLIKKLMIFAERPAGHFWEVFYHLEREEAACAKYPVCPEWRLDVTCPRFHLF